MKLWRITYSDWGHFNCAGKYVYVMRTYHTTATTSKEAVTNFEKDWGLVRLVHNIEEVE